jgi:hypothetical protein
VTTPQSDYLYYGEDAVKDFRTTAGSCKPSGFAEYDGLTGYVERTYTTTWRDKDGTLWRKTCQVLNLGRPDRGIVVDPDTAIAYEPWQDSKLPMQPNAPSAAIEAHHRNKEARHDAIQAQLVAYLREHGATSALALVDVVGKDINWVRRHLAEREHKAYKRIIVNSHIHKWEAL